jgi:hypothetical protein
MTPLQADLTSNFNAFISGFITKGYDFQIGVTTTDAYRADLNGDPSLAQLKDGVSGQETGVFVITPSTPNMIPTFVTNASPGDKGSGDERAFSSMRSALESPLNAGFHRDGAFLAVVILSDEDDFSGSRCENCGKDHDYSDPGLDPVENYVAYLDQLTGSSPESRRYSVSSIAVLDEDCRKEHATVIGTRYMQISNETNGILGSICGNFSESLGKISAKILELLTGFILDRTPVASSITVTVNGNAVAQDEQNGWSYDPTRNMVIFHGASVPDQGSIITIGYKPVEIRH